VHAHLLVLANLLIRPIVLLDSWLSEYSGLYLPTLGPPALFNYPLLLAWGDAAHTKVCALVPLAGRVFEFFELQQQHHILRANFFNKISKIVIITKYVAADPIWWWQRPGQIFGGKLDRQGVHHKHWMATNWVEGNVELKLFHVSVTTNKNSGDRWRFERGYSSGISNLRLTMFGWLCC